MSESNIPPQVPTLKMDDKPRIDVVLQATGLHGWSFSRGWVHALEREGLLHRVFYPTAEWEACEPRDDDGLFEYLQSPQADLILLLGFDWHSQPLHRSSRWKERWSSSPIRKIVTIPDSYSAEAVQKNVSWKQAMSRAIQSAIDCVDALICHHEPDVQYLRDQEKIKKPIIFLPFAIDPYFFRSRIPWDKRLNKGFFKGQISNHMNADPYKQRIALMERLKNNKNIDLLPLDMDRLKQPIEAVESYSNELAKYRILINLPSLSSTLTSRTFEIMGCGGLLLQNNVVGERSNQLFSNWENLVYYDPDDPIDLEHKIKFLIDNPDVTFRIAKRGHQVCIEKHTLILRIQEIINWINSGFAIETDRDSLPKQNEVTPDSIRINTIEADPVIVVDGVFFQFQKTGIYRYWHSVLKEWSKSRFRKFVYVLDRNKTAPIFSGINYRTFDPIDLLHLKDEDQAKTALDSQNLQFICDELKADIFISTYYTQPLTTPSVFLAYDMIPETLKTDLSIPMWREKRYGILHARKFLTISENTKKDLLKFYPFISPEAVTACGAGIDHDVFYPSTSVEIERFEAIYNIQNPYFLVVGTRFGVEGYKNVKLFFTALSRFYAREKVEVLCVGGRAELEPELSELSRDTRVQVVNLSDDEMRVAYSGALALVYPSLYEGFGLPLLEAMASGCPIITCCNSSIPEVVGRAAIYVNAFCEEGMLYALGEVLKPESREALIWRGRERCQLFSWQKTAAIMAENLLASVRQFRTSNFIHSNLVWQELRKLQFKAFSKLSS